MVTVYSLKERSREVHVVFPKLGSGKSQTWHWNADMGDLKEQDEIRRTEGEKQEKVNGSRTM